jgi:TrmH family RNA methyltransferase
MDRKAMDRTKSDRPLADRKIPETRDSGEHANSRTLKARYTGGVGKSAAKPERFDRREAAPQRKRETASEAGRPFRKAWDGNAGRLEGKPKFRSAPQKAHSDIPLSVEIKKYLPLKTDKGRYREMRFILEGVKAIRDVVSLHPGSLHRVFITEGFQDSEFLNALKKARVKAERVGEESVQALCSTETPQKVVAIADFATLKPDWNSARLVILLDAVQDPGNLGAILRTSAALGYDAVVLGKGTCDPYNPKVVRSSVGSLLRMPLETDEDLGAKIQFLRQKGFTIVATTPVATQTLEQLPKKKKVALLFGNEGAGLGRSYVDLSDAAVKIPIRSGVESLNVAVAHGILAWQLRSYLTH